MAATAQSATRGGSWLTSVSQRVTAVNKVSQAANNQLTAEVEKQTPNKPKPSRKPDPPLTKHMIQAATSVSLETASSGCWLDRAYLWTALCAWADPVCRSFCHSHNFFSLSRRERERRSMSASKSHKKQELKDSWVRPICLVQIQITPLLNLFNF